MNLICRLFGHSFEPRYDKSSANIPVGTKSVTTDALEAMRQITYRGDICKRCGQVTNQQQVTP